MILVERYDCVNDEWRLVDSHEAETLEDLEAIKYFNDVPNAKTKFKLYLTKEISADQAIKEMKAIYGFKEAIAEFDKYFEDAKETLCQKKI